jgi:pimeloyl-ACP methyl ester carboxylesterase
MRGRSSFITCPDGRSIHVQEHASGEGLPCLFIHGFADGGYVWNPFIASTSFKNNRLLTLDLPGHGQSSWLTQDRYERDALVADIIHVIDSLGLPKLVIVGHSLGGNLALRVTQQLGNRVVGVVAIDTPLRPSPVARKHLLAELAKFARPYASVDEYIGQLSLHRPLMASAMVRYVAVNALHSTGPGVFHLKLDPRVADLLLSHDGDDLEPIVRAIECPSLVVRGAISGVLSQFVAEELTRQMPRARLEIVPGAGHSVMLDNIFGFRKSIQPFLENTFSI